MVAELAGSATGAAARSGAGLLEGLDGGAQAARVTETITARLRSVKALLLFELPSVTAADGTVQPRYTNRVVVVPTSGDDLAG
jgi:hypothetical protein